MSDRAGDRGQETDGRATKAGDGGAMPDVVVVGPRPGLAQLLEALAYIRRCARDREDGGGAQS